MNNNVEETTELIPSSSNGNGHFPDLVDSEVNADGSRNAGVVAGGALMDAMRESEGFTALKSLVVPGDKVEELLMRGDLPSKNQEGHVRAVVIAEVIADCIEFNDTEGLQEVLNMVAALTSADGKRAKELVDAIVGFHREQNTNRGFGEKFQEAAGFTKKKD